MLFPRIDVSYCYRIHSSLTTICCFDNAYAGKQPAAWKEYHADGILFWHCLSVNLIFFSMPCMSVTHSYNGTISAPLS